ncbi:MAG TPA: hypothetical protein VM344_08530 [Vitreimonas sp.]|nr:hypothetical protein [Vitreimonas sp.]
MRPILILNPRHDDGFVTFAERALASGAATPEDLQAALRERYPRAVVRARDLSSESGLIWYVYRDGHWVS